MIEDNTPTVTARRRKPTSHLRLRLETARRLQNLNRKTKSKRAHSKAKQSRESREQLESAGSHAYNTAPRVPKIKKYKLSRPPPPESKYKKRQRCKTWLPTHVYHAKRAHMIELWRFTVPLSPTEKSYRPTHRARGQRGAVAWDMSYVSTIQIEGSETGLESVLRGLGVEGEEVWGVKGRKWRAGTRVLQTWVYEREEKSPIAPVTLIRDAEEKGLNEKEVEMVDADAPSNSSKKKDRKKIFIRVHPSAFLQLWKEVLEVSKMQSPPVMVEDLRFEIGSIEVTGPGATEALIATLQPTDGTPASGSPESTWTSLLGVTNPSSLPQNALLAFSISDPRLHFPSRTLQPLSDETYMQDQAILLASWPPDRTQSTARLFDRPSRLAATRQLPSQKAINRRRTLAGPGSRPSRQDSDPHIPIIVFASRPATASGKKTNDHAGNLPGSWTVLLPWKCVLPVWYSLMYYPLSSGGNLRFGGLQEQQQLAFEAGTPWFPGDFPGTRAGWEWELRQREQRHKQWESRPKGRRVEFNHLDLGNGCSRGEIGRGWACDWERLLLGSREEPQSQSQQPDSKHEEHAEHQKKQPAEAQKLDDLANAGAYAHPAHPRDLSPPIHIHQIPASEAKQRLSTQYEMDPKSDGGALTTVRIWLVRRGTPSPRARIYCLPEGEIGRRWLDLEKLHKAPAKENKSGLSMGMSPEDARRSLAASLISGPSSKSGSGSGSGDGEDELPIPTEKDLIGFVTTGGYNLAEGQGTGIGSIAMAQVIARKTTSSGARKGTVNKCIVRGAGERVGRLGYWEMI